MKKETKTNKNTRNYISILGEGYSGSNGNGIPPESPIMHDAIIKPDQYQGNVNTQKSPKSRKK